MYFFSENNNSLFLFFPNLGAVFDEIIPSLKTTVRALPMSQDAPATSTPPAELLAFSHNLIRTEKSTEYEIFELTLKGDMFSETFYCALDQSSRRFIVQVRIIVFVFSIINSTLINQYSIICQ